MKITRENTKVLQRWILSKVYFIFHSLSGNAIVGWVWRLFFFCQFYKTGFHVIEIGEGKAGMQHLIHIIVQIGGYLKNFVSSRNINFSPRKLKLNDWVFYWKRNHQKSMYIPWDRSVLFFLGPKKKWRKT
jgi:hypothetical protein